VQRREFITLVCGVAVAWPPAAHAQQPERMRLIGVLMGYAESDSEAQAQIAAFRDGLQKLGWMEGHNTRIDTRWAKPTDAAAMQRFAKELVALQPEVILASTTPTTNALLQQTRTIPIVFATVGDPIGSGFVASFPRPGGNVTGFVTIEGSLGGKWLELLKQIAPQAAQADCAARRSGRVAAQPGNGDVCRILPERLQSRRSVRRSAGGCSTCSR
jgi:putative ABC transport system substrate-binding protein